MTVAIFVAFAWMIEAAEWLGLIETEAQDPGSRAYRLAHQAVALFKRETVGCTLTFVSPRQIEVHGVHGSYSIESREGVLIRATDGHCETLLDLGPDGGAHFVLGRRTVEITIAARTDQGDGAYDVTLALPISRAPLDLAGG